MSTFQFQPDYPPQPPAPKRHRRWPWIIAAIVAIVVVAGIAGSIGGHNRTDAFVASSGAPTTTQDTFDTAAAPAGGLPCQGCIPESQQTYPPTTTTPTTTTAAVTTPEVPAQEQNAINSAQQYLSFQAFSRAGLIRQLSSSAGDGYPKDVATAAVDSLDVDWNAQAAKSAQNYLDLTSFSCNGLIQQLESSAGEEFTHAQAVYGAHQTSACG